MREAQLLERLSAIAGELDALDAQQSKLWAERVKLYRKGVDGGVTKAAMARAAGCSPEAVIHTLRRADASRARA